MVILKSIESIMSIIIMVSLGVYLSYKRWFNEDISTVFTKLVTNISLPLLMIYSLMNNFNRSKLLDMSSGLIIPFLTMAICYLVGIFAAKIFCSEKINEGLFISMFFNSNTIFIGLPVNIALFGQKSLPYVLLYYIANTTFFWTIGVHYIQKSSKSGSNVSLSAPELIKKLFSPPLIGFIVAVILIIFEVKLPPFIMDTCQYMGNLTTPLSMLFIGIVISKVNIRKINLGKDVLGIVFGRFLLSPIIVILLAYRFPISNIMKSVFIIQASMPAMTQTSIVAKNYGADEEYAAIMTVITTILAVITIPIFMSIINY
jgi:predicted permease